MEELTLRLPAETKESLQAEAATRGVSLGDHIRDILETYQGQSYQDEQPSIDIEYAHTVDRDSELTDSGSDEHSDTKTIGSFTYGSRSILS